MMNTLSSRRISSAIAWLIASINTVCAILIGYLWCEKTSLIF
jgi:hypothetical protein